MEPQTCANQVLPQIATLVSIDLGARIIEVVVFDKGAELGDSNNNLCLRSPATRGPRDLPLRYR